MKCTVIALIGVLVAVLGLVQLASANLGPEAIKLTIKADREAYADSKGMVNIKEVSDCRDSFYYGTFGCQKCCDAFDSELEAEEREEDDYCHCDTSEITN